jgi:uncharacterized protein
MIKRDIVRELRALVGEYPVVTVLGPRQAGKTTLVKMALKGYAYSNLETPDVRDLAIRDPRAYLAQFSGPVILDEIQRAPELLSYIQVIVDEEKRNGRFVLTGSHQLRLREAVTQSLAGRTSILTLYPLSLTELESAGHSAGRFEDVAFRGFLPRLHAESLRPVPFHSNYYQTYVERDVRQLIQLKDAALFEKTMKLVAGRTGQLMDCSSLANDVGVDAKTIRHWLSILEASFVLFKLPPYFENFGKRVIKSPKYYFTDVGLLCFLLGIRTPEQITRDPLVGAIFENLVVMECLKAQANRGEMPALYFYRDSHGNEVDLLAPEGRTLHAAEIKSASTFSDRLLQGLRKFRSRTESTGRTLLIYNGKGYQLSDGVEAVPFRWASRLIGG